MEPGSVSVLELELERMLELRLQSAQADRTSLRERLDVLDAQLKKQIAVVGKRPNHTDAELQELARQKEFTHATTNMSLMKEKAFLREMEQIQKQRKDLVEFNKKQAEIETVKATRAQVSAKLREKEEELDELFSGSRKLKVANVIKCNPADVVDKKITVQEDNMARIIGKGGSGIKAIEEEFRVVIFSERANVLRIMGLEDDVSTAYGAILLKANCVTENMTLHPALKACLMLNKAALSKNIQDNNEVKLSFNKSDCICKIYGQAINVTAAKAEILTIPYSKIKIKIDPTVVPRLVGKGGSNLRGMYDENLVQVDLLKDEGVVAIYGLQTDAAPVADAIRSFCEDNKEAAESLTVTSFLMHNNLQAITAAQKKGANVECTFGKNDEDCNISIKGSSLAVSTALEEIRAVIDAFNANLVAIEYHASVIPSIIGKAGATIKQLRADHPSVNVQLNGSTVFVHSLDKEARDAVVSAIGVIAEANYAESVSMPRDTTITLRGAIGEPVRAKISALKLNMHIDQEGEMVRLVGREDDVKAGAVILANFRENSINIEIDIHADEGSAVSGMIAEFEEKFGVHVALTNKRQTVRFIGTKESCEKAKARLIGILEGKKEFQSSLLPIQSADFSIIIGTKGRNLDLLEKQFDVKVDVVKYKSAIRVRGNDNQRMATEKEILRIIADNTKVSTSVPFPRDLSMDSAMRCVSEASRLFGIDVVIRIADKQFSIRGKKDIVSAVQAFLLEFASGVATDTVPLYDRHGSTLSREQFKSIAETSFVSIRLDQNTNSLYVTGSITSIKLAVESIYSTMAELFPMMYDSVSMSLFCMADVCSSYNIALIETQTGAKLFADRFMSRLYARGDCISIQNALKAVDEKVSAWESGHMIVDGFDESSITALLAKQGEMLSTLEKDTGTSIRLSRNPRCLLVEASSHDDLLAAKTVILAKLTLAGGSQWEVIVNSEVVGAVIGKQGSVIKKLRADSGAAIDIDQEENLIRVSGSESSVASAREMIEEILLSKSITEIGIPNEAFSLIIGPKGANIKAIEQDTGAKVDVDKNKSAVVIKGTVEAREAASTLVMAKLHDGGFESKSVVARAPSVVKAVNHNVGALGDFLPHDVASKNYNKEKRVAKQGAFLLSQVSQQSGAIDEKIVPVSSSKESDPIVIPSNGSTGSQKTQVIVEVNAEYFVPSTDSTPNGVREVSDDQINFFGQLGVSESKQDFSSESTVKINSSGSESSNSRVPAPATVNPFISQHVSPVVDANTAFLLNLLNVGSGSSSKQLSALLTSQAKEITSGAQKSTASDAVAPPGLSLPPSDFAYGRKLDDTKESFQSSKDLKSTASSPASSDKYFKSKSGLSVRL